MKQMVYQSERKIEVLDTGYCYGYLYYILNLGTHPTAYIKIPKEHTANKYESYTSLPLDVHGGLTFMSDHLIVGRTDKDVIEGKFIGWDYAHAGDYTGHYGEYSLWENEKKWTTQEIFEEVKEACYELEILDRARRKNIVYKLKQLFKKIGGKTNENRN